MRIFVRIGKPASGAAVTLASVEGYGSQMAPWAVPMTGAGDDISNTAAIWAGPFTMPGRYQWRAKAVSAEGCTDASATDGRRTFEVVK